MKLVADIVLIYSRAIIDLLQLMLRKSILNRNQAMVRYNGPFSIEGSCNVTYISERVQYSYGKLCFFAFIWFPYFHTGLELRRIPASVSKGSFADFFFLLIFDAKIG